MSTSLDFRPASSFVVAGRCPGCGHPVAGHGPEIGCTAPKCKCFFSAAELLEGLATAAARVSASEMVAALRQAERTLASLAPQTLATVQALATVRAAIAGAEALR